MPFDPYDAHTWWLFDSRESSEKTCPVCLGLHMTHYRGDAIQSAFPYHMAYLPNKLKAKVHPHCRCLLVWTGTTKSVMDNPYGILKRPAQKAELPAKVAGKKIELSPSQQRLWKRTSGHAKETYRGKRK